ncbi:ubiquitin-associated protein 1-like isoform X2 [Haliotis rufescens]|uniref:ubiquitin-associated protein 1-like isoform X2 n=1 Tax=Haliotis rufescens TaxID=6454 RepID=UPI00201EEC3F|nr:ubiquitin-associated protein 1-like isoform X2 [Haliotis rufescens]
MAYSYNRSHSRNSSTGLASSNSCLDGVPFKVGPKFKPPPRVFLPPELRDTASASQVVNDEYLFETEDAVLRWAQAREEAKVEQERLKAEKVANAIQELSQPQDSDDSDSSDGGENGTAEAPFQGSALLPQQAPALQPQPALATMSNDILTPVPIMPAKTVEPAQQETTKTVDLDLALFEREDDPFENVERQLINEMEELKTLLGPLNNPPSDLSPSNNTTNCDTNMSNNTCNSPALNGAMSKTDVQSTTAQQPGSDGERLDRHSPAPVFVPQSQPFEEGDYVELRLDYNSQGSNSVSFKASDKETVDSVDNSSPRVDPAASNKIYRQVLPPIGTPMSKVRPVLSPGLDSLAKTLSENTVPEPSAAAVAANPSAVSNGVLNKYSRHCETSSVTCAQQSETWNPYKPLPPTPDVMSSSVHSSSSSSDLTSPSEFDPYTTLSSEAQKFAANLISMGFSRPQVARAVHKQGTDEKQVVEYLCHVNNLVEKGFNPIRAELALNLFDNNFPKAEKYLEMFVQFQELGFGEDKIREALVKENMDRDKALDFLTA